MIAFDGFPPDAWRFLDLLAKDNTGGCFDRHREVYRSAIAAPSHALVEALIPQLATEVHPTLTGEPKVGRSLFRINRDTRFAADKTPYKTYVDFLFWAGNGDPRSSAPKAHVKSDRGGPAAGVRSAPGRGRAAIAERGKGAGRVAWRAVQLPLGHARPEAIVHVPVR